MGTIIFSFFQGKGEMLTWWLNGHDHSTKMKQTPVSETKESDNNNTIPNAVALNSDLDEGLISLNSNVQTTENSRNASDKRQRRNSSLAIGMVPNSQNRDVNAVSDDNSNKGYPFTPVELPGQVT